MDYEVITLDTQEEWRPVVGHEGIYDVSNMGRVRRALNAPPRNATKPGRILKQDRHNSGYLRVNIQHDGKLTRTFVHRIVARAFLDGFESNRQVNHKNGDKHDNRVENLEWVTHRENVLHAWKTGLNRPNQGENHGASVMTDREAAASLYLLANGVEGQLLAGAFGVTQSAISSLKRGETWKHLTPKK